MESASIDCQLQMMFLEEAPKLKEQYDLVIADGPAGLSEVTRAILLRADVALLPCGPSTMDLRPAKDSMRVLKLKVSK